MDKKITCTGWTYRKIYSGDTRPESDGGLGIWQRFIGFPLRRLNQAVKCNKNRFPGHFMLQLIAYTFYRWLYDDRLLFLK